MSSKIAVLSEDTINQIAAGEVIENPACVIKELVDNAIDAGSKRIDVRIEGGGQLLISVEDDGCGMGKKDLELCLLRHATSKIRTVDDLQQLETMGFRGEALAAIASVSKVEIRTSDGREATRLLAEGGRVLEIEGCARNRGTTIVVRSLFYNAPARRKFQKSPQSGCVQAMKMVQTLALSHPEIAFSFSSQQEKLLEFRETDWKGRVEEALGSEACAEGLWIEQPGICGFLAHESQAKKTRAAQHFFLNRRPVVSFLFSKALKEGYGTRLPEGVHPAAVLFLKKDPEEFDVNVHPQKKEVRFRDEGSAYTELKRAVGGAFMPRDLPAFKPISFEASPYRGLDLPWEAASSESLAEKPLPLLRPSKGVALATAGSFLLARREDGRIVLADLSNCLKNKPAPSDSCESQALLEPAIVSFSSKEAGIIDSLIERCKGAGIEARRFGQRQLCVDSLPAGVQAEDLPRIVEELKEEILFGAPAGGALQKSREKFRMTLEEARLLWESEENQEVVLDAGDLERMYRRKMSGQNHEK